MLNPQELMKVLEAASKMGTSAQSSLSQPFIQGVSNIQMSGPNAASDIISHVSGACNSMFSSMNSVFDGLQSNVTAHQAQQQGKQPKDFTTATDDLRPTVSRGFPKEMEAFFSKVPKI
jgi:hypothetical protein